MYILKLNPVFKDYLWGGTKLRDEYPSLEELCSSLCVSKEEIEKKLITIGYAYSEETNSFK